jgi:hypothetical protein
MKLSAIERSSLILFGLAVLILAAVAFISSSELVAATLVLIAFACFVSGLFSFTFQKKEQVDARTAALLSVPSMTTPSRLLADLGVSGAARFIPVDETFPSPVMQYNPVSEYRPVRITEDKSFLTEGVLSVPSGWPLFSHLTKEKSLTVPGSEPDLFSAVKEAAEDLLELADKVDVTRDGDEITISMKNYLLLSGCRLVREESPRICVLSPCPVCSLFAMMLAQGFGNPVTLEQVSVEEDVLVVRLRQNWIGEALESPAVSRRRRGPGLM